MTIPVPENPLIFRIIHVDNLHICLRRGGLYAPNHFPSDGLVYKTIHNDEIQFVRHDKPIPCGPRGTIHDYVSFYFGPRSPMLFQLHTGHVSGYNEGQEPLIYLVSNVQTIVNNHVGFVFSDGHGIAHFTSWSDNLDELNNVDWNTVSARQWNDTPNDPDRQRRKQAEFLIHKFLDWSFIIEIAVMAESTKEKVEAILGRSAPEQIKQVTIKPEWYY